MKITELINKAIHKTKNPDPTTIAQSLINELTENQKTEMIEKGLIFLVHQEILSIREKQRGRFIPTTNNNTPLPMKSSAKGIPRMIRLIRNTERVCVKKQWKTLAQCTLSDIRWLANDYQSRSESYAEKSQEYAKLGDELESSGINIVGEFLKEEKVA